MGYSERLCHICGVSFNLGRIRTKDEPRSHAWHQLRHRENRFFVDASRNSHIGECGRDAGCMLAFRDDVARELERQGRDRVNKVTEQDDHCLSREAKDVQERDSDDDDEFLPDELIMQKLWIDEEFSAMRDATSPQKLPGSTQSMANGAEDSQFGSTIMQDDQSALTGIYSDDHISEDMEYDTPTETCSETEDEHQSTRMTSVSDCDDETAAQYRAFVDSLQLKDSVRYMRDEENLLLPLFRPLSEREEDVASAHGSDASFECDEEKDSHEWNARKLDHWISGKLSHYNHHLSKSYSRHHRDSIWEHIAGPGCVNTNGYHGTRITEEEMQFANTLQCLVRKTQASIDAGDQDISAMPEWHPEWDDEPWERESLWFLSGVSDHMPSRDYDDPRVLPPRHSCERPNAENICWSQQNDSSEQYAMPFHPSCFEIYKRVAIKRHGYLDVDLLGSWWQLKSRYADFHSFPRSEAVKMGERQWWRHNPGDEYLASDPLWPSGLKVAIMSAKSVKSQAKTTKPAASRWSSLPLEVITEILAYLDVVSIAKTSLAVPDTCSVAKQMMQRCLQLQYPSLWELTTALPYYKWVGLTANVLETRQKAFDQQNAEFQLVYSILEEEGYDDARDELKQHWEQHNEARKEKIFGSVMREKLPLTVPTDEVGIAKFVLALHEAEEIDNLRGLRNRDRIWKDCEIILDQIGYLQDQGEILPNRRPRPGARLFEH